MPTWNNKPLTVYHGTDDASLGRPGVTQGTVLNGFVVNLSLCRPLTDFGQGFYTTTSLHQARECTLLHGSAGLSVLGPGSVERHSPFGERDFASRWSRLLPSEASTVGKSG